MGVYVGGSFSTGDFVANVSDFDLLVVVDDELTPALVERLTAYHAQLRGSGDESMRLEGDYVPLRWLVPEGTSRPVWWFRDGALRPPEFMLSADNIANLRRDGVAVYGPPARTLLPEVTAEQVRAAVRTMLADEPSVETEGDAARELIDVARSLSALDSGEPTSRSAGLAWAHRRMDPRWHPALRRAAEVRAGASVDPSDDTLRRALASLRSSLGLRS